MWTCIVSLSMALNGMESHTVSKGEWPGIASCGATRVCSDWAAESRAPPQDLSRKLH